MATTAAAAAAALPQQGKAAPSPPSSDAAPKQQPAAGDVAGKAPASKAGKKDKAEKKGVAKHKKKGSRDSSPPSSSSPSSSSSASDSSSDSSDGDERALKRKSARHALDPWRYPFYTPSASYRQIDALAGSHQYTICGFSLARAMGCGNHLCSDFFEVAGQLFRVEVYPAGFTADSRKYVSVFLTTPGAVNPNHVMFEFAILDQSGKDKHIATSSQSMRRHLHNPLMMHARGVVGAALRLAKASVLDDKRKRYLPHDTLVVRATVHVLRGWGSPPALHPHVASSHGVAPAAPRTAMAVMPGQMAASTLHSMAHPPMHYPHYPLGTTSATLAAANWATGVANLAAFSPPVPGVHTHLRTSTTPAYPMSSGCAADSPLAMQQQLYRQGVAVGAAAAAAAGGH